MAYSARPEAMIAEHHAGDREGECREPHRERQAEEGDDHQAIERVGKIEQRPPARRADQHAAKDDQHGERHDEGAETQAHHHEAVDEADQAANEEHHENADGAGQLEAEAEFGGGHDHHRADCGREAVDRTRATGRTCR